MTFLAQTRVHAEDVEEDSVEGEVNVESGDVSKTEDDDDDSSGTAEGLTSSPDADLTILFTKPAGNGFGLYLLMRFLLFGINRVLIFLSRITCW